MKIRPLFINSIFGISHLFLVLYVIKSILAGTEDDWPMYWTFLILFDLPLLLINYCTEWIFSPVFHNIAAKFPNDSPLSSAYNFWSPLFYFGILGTIFWFLIPLIIKVLIKKAK